MNKKTIIATLVFSAFMLVLSFLFPIPLGVAIGLSVLFFLFAMVYYREDNGDNNGTPKKPRSKPNPGTKHRSKTKGRYELKKSAVVESGFAVGQLAFAKPAWG